MAEAAPDVAPELGEAPPEPVVEPQPRPEPRQSRQRLRPSRTSAPKPAPKPAAATQTGAAETGSAQARASKARAAASPQGPRRNQRQSRALQAATPAKPSPAKTGNRGHQPAPSPRCASGRQPDRWRFPQAAFPARPIPATGAPPKPRLLPIGPDSAVIARQRDFASDQAALGRAAGRGCRQAGDDPCVGPQCRWNPCRASAKLCDQTGNHACQRSAGQAPCRTGGARGAAWPRRLTCPMPIIPVGSASLPSALTGSCPNEVAFSALAAGLCALRSRRQRLPRRPGYSAQDRRLNPLRKV